MPNLRRTSMVDELSRNRKTRTWERKSRKIFHGPAVYVYNVCDFFHGGAHFHNLKRKVKLP